MAAVEVVVGAEAAFVAAAVLVVVALVAAVELEQPSQDRWRPRLDSAPHKSSSKLAAVYAAASA